jgi:UDP-N-acetylmuramate-alanine ligase
VARDPDALLAGLVHDLHAGDHALLMSNGGFDGLHERLLRSLASAQTHT